MKIFKILSFCLLIFLSLNFYAQEPDMNLESLKTPSMPSATIIGTQVNEVNKPKSLKALEAAVFSNYLDSNQSLTIPNNYALEFNPFMLSGRKNFNYQDYIDNEPLSNMWRNLSISVSSTTDFLINDSTSSNAMGFGIRTIIFNGKPDEEIEEAYQKALRISLDVLNIKTSVRTLISVFKSNNRTDAFTIDDVRSFVITELEKSDKLNNPKDKNGNDLSGYELTKHYIILTKRKAIVNSVFDEIDRDTPIENLEDAFEKKYDTKISQAALTELRETLGQIKHNRYGWRWEVDFAYALSFPTNEFNNSIWSRWGLWSSASYQPERWEDFIFIGLGRIIINNDNFYKKYRTVDNGFNVGDIYDFGARVVYEYKKLSVEFEYIYRFNRIEIIRIIDGEEFKRNIGDNTEKYMLNVNYNVSDNINISYNIGKNFDNISTAGGNLISGLSINFGFGDIKAADLLSQK